MSTPDSQLVDLLQKARDGDDEARDALFAKCRNYLAVLARAHVHTWLQAKVDASDVVQQTLLEAHRDFANFQGQGEGQWCAWLRQLLMHNAADFVRRYQGTQKRQAGREISIGPRHSDGTTFVIGEPRDPAESPSQQVMQREREIQMADAIAKLSPDHQEVIILRNIQHLPFDEVAHQMGRTRPAVQMLWMRAIHKLRDLLEA